MGKTKVVSESMAQARWAAAAIAANLPRLEAFGSYFGIAYYAATRARFATDSIASTILE